MQFSKKARAKAISHQVNMKPNFIKTRKQKPNILITKKPSTKPPSTTSTTKKPLFRWTPAPTVKSLFSKIPKITPKPAETSQRDYEMIWTTRGYPVIVTAKPTNTTDNTNIDALVDDNNDVLIGSIVGGILGLIVIALLMFVIIKRNICSSCKHDSRKSIPPYESTFPKSWHNHVITSPIVPAPSISEPTFVYSTSEHEHRKFNPHLMSAEEKQSAAELTAKTLAKLHKSSVDTSLYGVTDLQAGNEVTGNTNTAMTDGDENCYDEAHYDSVHYYSTTSSSEVSEATVSDPVVNLNRAKVPADRVGESDFNQKHSHRQTPVAPKNKPPLLPRKPSNADHNTFATFRTNDTKDHRAPPLHGKPNSQGKLPPPLPTTKPPSLSRTVYAQR